MNPIALESTKGDLVSGTYGDQVMFRLTDGRCLYVSPTVAHEIRATGIQPGEPFTLVKVRRNGRLVTCVRKEQPSVLGLRLLAIVLKLRDQLAQLSAKVIFALRAQLVKHARPVAMLQRCKLLSKVRLFVGKNDHVHNRNSGRGKNFLSGEGR